MERRWVREQLRPPCPGGGTRLSDRVRPIRPDEWPLLRELRLAALLDAPTAFGGRIREEREWPEDRWSSWASDSADGDDQVMFFATVADRVVGLAGGHAREDPPGEVGLYAMWVEPSVRGTGVSRELVQAVVDWARARGAKRISLWVTVGNEAAERLYARHGFTDTGERRAMRWDESIAIMRMALDL